MNKKLPQIILATFTSLFLVGLLIIVYYNNLSSIHASNPKTSIARDYVLTGDSEVAENFLLKHAPKPYFKLKPGRINCDPPYKLDRLGCGVCVLPSYEPELNAKLATINGYELRPRAKPVAVDCSFPNDSGEVAVADFNGDGLVDIVTRSLFSNALCVFENHSSEDKEEFKNIYKIMLSTWNGGHIEIADMNYDGKKDIIASYNTPHGDYATPANIWLENVIGSNRRNFLTKTWQLASPGFLDFRVVSPQRLLGFNFISSLYYLDESPQGTSLFRNNIWTSTPFSNNSYVSPDELSLSDKPWKNKGYVFADNKGLSTTKGLSGYLVLYSNYNLSVLINSLYIADIDNDGVDDIIALLDNGAIYLWSGVSPYQGHFLLGNNGGRNVFNLAGGGAWLDFGDLDGDGDTDVAVATHTINDHDNLIRGGQVYWLEQNGENWLFHEVIPNIGRRTGIAIADMNGDGCNDIVTSGSPTKINLLSCNK